MLNFSVTFFFSLINIGILFFVLRAILFKPVTKFMADRQAKIEADIANADREREAAKTLKKKYEDDLAALQAEAAKIVAAARAEGQQQAEALVAAARAQGAALTAAAEKQIAAERNAALLLFRAEAAALVVAASRRLLRREISADDAAVQAELFLNELDGKRDAGV
jgi:F-type H+-transporting ATPase subunit b